MVSQFGSLGYTIMGKTADLSVVQKTIIDTFTRRVSHKHSLPKKLACSQSAVSKHVNRKLSGRKMCVKKKMHNQPREPQPYEDCQQNRFKNLGELSRGWTEAGVKASRATTHRRVRNLATVSYSSC